MKRTIKKQFWVSKEEDELIKEKSNRCCLDESALFRLLVSDFTPKEKPSDEFYNMMNKMNEFINELTQLKLMMKQTGNINLEAIEQEIIKWNEFQLLIENRYLLPEENTNNGNK